MIRIIPFSLLCLLLICMGCDQKHGDINSMNEDKTIEQQNFRPEEINMTMVQTTYPTPTIMFDVTIKNNTSIKVYTGLDYSIEYYDGTTWNKLPLDFTYFLSLITILPQESKDFSIYLYPEQYNYQQGKYRVRKTVQTTTRKDDPKSKLYDLTAEFNIE